MNKERTNSFIAEIEQALDKTNLEITEVSISDVSNNIIVSYLITGNYLEAHKQILIAIQGLENHGYGLFIDAHNKGGYTMITSSFSKVVVYTTDWDSVRDYAQFSMLSNHLSVPKKLR